MDSSLITKVQDVWAWFDPTLFSIGVGAVIAWWFWGMMLGWIFDLIRRS